VTILRHYNTESRDIRTREKRYTRRIINNEILYHDALAPRNTLESCIKYPTRKCMISYK